MLDYRWLTTIGFVGNDVTSVAATGAITVVNAIVVGNGDTVTVGNTVATAGTDFALGEDNNVMASEIATYFQAQSAQVFAVAADDIVSLTARVPGTSGNLIALSETGSGISVSGETLEGGA